MRKPLTVKEQVQMLREQRDQLWAEFQKEPIKNSVHGLNFSEALAETQLRLDQLGDKTERYFPEIDLTTPPN